MTRGKHVGSSPWAARLVRLVIGGAARLPFPWAQTCGRLAGTLGARVPNPQRAIAGLNLKLCFPDMPAAEQRRLLRRNLEETGKAFLECAAIWRWPAERLVNLEEGVDGEELLERAMAAGKGTLLLAPHLGNWEFLNPFLVRRAPFISLYRPPRIAELEGVLRRARERFGVELVPATPAGLRPYLRALRAGRLALLLPDQEPLEAHGVHAPFFGVPALTMTLASRLLRRTGAAALFVVAERQASGKFRVRFSEAPEAVADADAERAAAALNRGVEACVRRCPEQYLWAYKRFATALPGEPTPYRAIWSRKKLARHPWPPADAG